MIVVVSLLVYTYIVINYTYPIFIVRILYIFV